MTQSSAKPNLTWKQLLAPLASLKLTVVLLVLSMLLIYAGTWAQIDNGIWQVQKQYFHSFFTWITFQTFFPRPKAGEMAIPGGFPMLGGYTLGTLLLLNLIAAHLVRFKFAWRRVGVILIHLGLILLLVGEGITSGMAVESQMTIDEGSSASYSQDIRHAELAIVDTSAAERSGVAVIPASRLHDGTVIKDSRLPVEVKVEQFFANSSVFGPMQQAPAEATSKATAGGGVGLKVVPQPRVSGVEAENVDAPSAYVTLSAPGQNIGTFLVSLFLERPQEFTVGGKTYTIALRFQRLYKPYTIHLLDFKHDKYLGTDVPKDFSSHVRLVDPTHNVDREVRIWMNNPLRYRGETFYQSGFKPGDKTTILQVVDNPGWLMPYFACAIGALGMVIHFGMNLTRFVRKRLATPVTVSGSTSPAAGLPLRGGSWLSGPTLAAIAIVLLYYAAGLLGSMRPASAQSGFDLKTFSTLPVSHEGRTQPLDSLARNSLKVISGREKAAIEKPLPRNPFLESIIGPREKKIHATAWLADVFGQPQKAAGYPIFRIDNKEVVGLLNLDDSRKRFSFQEILAGRDKLQEQLDRAHRIDAKERDLFQRKVVELGEKLTVYMRLAQMESLFLIPPLAPSQQWQPLSNVMHGTAQQPANPAALAYMNLVSAYNTGEVARFNREVASFAAQFRTALPEADARVKFEAFFNRFSPFAQCIALYVFAFVMVCLSWLFWEVPLRRAATFAVLFALVVHTAGLMGRVYISGRPPVTNLASSAIFIAWGAVILAIGLEFFFRDGIGTACAAVIGFLSLFIADRLALGGDTLKVLQAVLDTNFWLATHVVVIALGYAATFLAGVLGIVYVIRGVFSRSLDNQGGKDLVRMIYGITCFAILFSFVGTILGGIWADQSWGRFWGWDPKENGAVLIVLANALLLHARWGGLVRDRGIACLAIFGNIITSWSWFGTNMLGVGLHSYGFMDSALLWLLVFVASQVVLIAVANVPLRLWRSYPRLTAPSVTRGRPTSKILPASA